MTFRLMRRLSSAVIGRGVGSGSPSPTNRPATASASSSCICLEPAPGMQHGRLELVVLRRRQAVEQEASPRTPMTGVAGVEGFRAPEDQSELAFPLQRPAAVGAEMAHPFAVVDLAQGVEHLRKVVPVQAEHRREILQHQDSERADLAQQCRPRRLGPSVSWGCRKAARRGTAVVTSSTLGRRSMALRISVLADDGGAIRPSQTGGPGRWLAAMAPSVT